MNFPLSSNQNYIGCFPDVSSVTTYSLLRVCVILGDYVVYSSTFNFINFILIILYGKAELSMASCTYNKRHGKVQFCPPTSPKRQQFLCHKFCVILPDFQRKLHPCFVSYTLSHTLFYSDFFCHTLFGTREPVKNSYRTLYPPMDLRMPTTKQQISFLPAYIHKAGQQKIHVIVVLVLVVRNKCP